MKKIAFYGGSFDPVHIGHRAIARALLDLFAFDEFFFIPAFHAPHKKDKKPTSAFHRYAMLALATGAEANVKISTVELDAPERPFTFETQTKLRARLGAEARLFFVIGADSWAEIDTWREWEKVLRLTSIIVVTRPGFEISTEHVAAEDRKRIVDLRGTSAVEVARKLAENPHEQIFVTDAVCLDVSATEIRRMIFARHSGWQSFVPEEVVGYIEKYELYI